MIWLMIGYMFLFIHRPFEFWTILGDFHIERVYISVVFLAWLLYPKKRWIPNSQHQAYFLFALSVLFCWALSSWMEAGQIVVENWFKILFFYVLIVTVIQDEEDLKKFCLGFLVIMGLYMSHSLKEFIGGRHTYRMSIVRLIGVDTSLGDPNSFGASVLFAMPMVTAFWNSQPSSRLRFGLVFYLIISVICILLTGSRSSFICMLVWMAILIWKSRFRVRAILFAILMSPLVFFALPDSLQNRFETIIDPSVGPKNAHVSGQGRIDGLLTGFELLAENPLSGIGPGAWRPATGSEIESHNLYGQVMGEMGFLGVFSFGMILWYFWSNLVVLKKMRREQTELENAFIFQLSSAIGMGIFLMLLNGNFGHNLFRHNWLWYGGFLIIARYSAENQLMTAEEQHIEATTWRISYPEHGRSEMTQPEFSV